MGVLSWLAHCLSSPSAQKKRDVFEGASPSIEAVAAGIKAGRYRNVIVLCGAGISVNAGIPDFRSRAGMYDLSRRFSMPNPWAVFDIGFFHQTATPFFSIVRSIVMREGTFASYPPTATHCFFHLLEQKGVLLRVYTQNVDCLELCAGLSKGRLVQMHGHMADAHCTSCKARGSVPEIAVALRGRPCADGSTAVKDLRFEHLSDDGSTIWSVPRCTKCKRGVVKPDVVLFNEGIPAANLARAAIDFPRCDLLLCFGSTFKVMPFAQFIGAVDDVVPRVLFNMEMVGRAEDDGPLHSSKVCFQFTDPTNYRDVFVEGDCDVSVRRLAAALGWSAELEALHEERTKFPMNVERLQLLQEGKPADGVAATAVGRVR